MDKPKTPPVFIFAVPPVKSASSPPISHWVKKFFACNPFYLFSAALLLYGVYLVSFDANFSGREKLQLAFNFSSIQVYEILLVVTAIILARRRIWYDSLLLVGLENLLVLVPFILISQAALLSHRIVVDICLVGAMAVLLRFWSLKRFFGKLNLPRRALVCGLALLLINVVLPLIYRHLHDSKIGTKPTDGAAYDLNRYCWLLLAPAMVATFNLLPRARATGNLPPQRRWLPMGLFTLWLAGSVVHIYCLSYIYNFDWEFVFALPLLWAAVWTAYLRYGDLVAKPAAVLAKVLLVPPLAVALVALAQTGHAVFLTLTVLNLGCYLALFLKDRRNLTAFHLLLISGATLLAGIAKPREVAPAGFNSIGPGKWLLICAVAYGLYWIVRSRNPKAGVWGGLLVAITVFALVPEEKPVVELSVQCGLVFLLLHSLTWVDAEHRGASAARKLASVLWFGISFGMAHWQGTWAKEIIFAGGGVVMAAAIGVKLFTGVWRPAVVPIAAALVLLIPPGDFAAGKLRTAPAGLLAVAGSFLLFAIGTIAALTKPRWNPPAISPPAAAAESEPAS